MLFWSKSQLCTGESVNLYIQNGRSTKYYNEDHFKHFLNIFQSAKCKNTFSAHVSISKNEGKRKQTTLILRDMQYIIDDLKYHKFAFFKFPPHYVVKSVTYPVF